MAILGTLYAMLGGGAAELSVALVTGGVVQFAGAATAWSSVRDDVLGHTEQARARSSGAWAVGAETNAARDHGRQHRRQHGA